MRHVFTRIAAAVGLAIQAGGTSGWREPSPSPPPATRNSTSLDLQYGKLDPNGLPLSPRWRTNSAQQAIDPSAWCGDLPSHCTSQGVSEDKWASAPLFLCRDPWPFGDVVGHWNWPPEAVTYAITAGAGSKGLFFEDWNAWPMDDDYDMSIGVSWPAALTNGNEERVLNLEFEAGETIRHFTTDWWHQLREDVRLSPRQRRLIAETAFVVGQIGLDRVHNYATELHPVHALAALVETTALPNSRVLQHWVFFARNWGSEGECSSMAHPIPGNSMSFDLPAPPGMPVPTVEKRSCLRTNISSPIGDVTIGRMPDGSARVRLPLGAPASRARVSGELYLEWSASGTSQSPATCLTPPLRAVPEIVKDDGSYDDSAFVKILQTPGDTREQTKKRLLNADQKVRRQYYERTLKARILTQREKDDDVNLRIRFLEEPRRD